MNLYKYLVFALSISCAFQQAPVAAQNDHHEESPQSRGLFYTIDDDAYRLTVVSYEDHLLTLSDGSIWRIAAMDSFTLPQGEEITIIYRAKIWGCIWLDSSGLILRHAEFVGVVSADYKTIQSMNGNNSMVLSDGSSWSIPQISISSRQHVKKWKVGDKVFISKEWGKFFDHYHLINLELVNLDEGLASAMAFKESE